MSNDNNRNRGRPAGEDDARALFDALDPAIRNLLIEEARRRGDTPQPSPHDDMDFQPGPSTSHANFQPSSSRGNFQPSSS
uniref:Uncharacterized protein n=1 Tax=Panagrolaimus sp. PS1159 TaxID=55785 RepID=A0AC35FIZ4_9BILA